MSWIQENKVPAAILGVSGVGVIGLGVVLFMAYSSYSESLDTFESVNNGIATLKSAPLAPTDANLQAKKALVDEYQTVVNRLNTVLNRLQAPDEPTTDTEFQARLKVKIAETRRMAANLRVGLPADFNLAFDRYTTALPKSNEVATELSGYLNAMDEIVRMLMESGVLSIDLIERSDLPSESDAPPKAPARPKGPQTPGRPGVPPPAAAVAEKVTQAHQVRVVLRTDQAALQLIMSKLANPSDMPGMPYFPVVRLLRIENERQEGPLRSAMAAAIAESVDPETGEPVAAPAAAEGTRSLSGIPATTPAPKDSIAVLGQEPLRAFLEIDLIKFFEPKSPAAPPQRTR